MKYFEFQADHETSERAGAGGMFQVISLSDADGHDKTDLIDQGTHYTYDSLKTDLAKITGVKESDIDLQEV